MKKFIEMLKTDKQKLIILIVCIVILISSIVYFCMKKSTMGKLKDEDQAIVMLLDTFYGDEVDKTVSEVMLGKNKDKYFQKIKEDSYDVVYDQLKVLGEGVLVNNRNAKQIANNYTEASMDILKKVSKVKVAKKEKVDNGYRFRVEITPANLNDAYKKGNDCAASLITKTQKEDPNFAEIDGYQYAIYYDCMAEGMKGVSSGKGEKTTVNVVMKKNKKGQFIPTKESLKSLLSAAY